MIFKSDPHARKKIFLTRKKSSPQENKYFSYNQGDLAQGCRYCVKGEKLVLFITGKCPRNCYFCPVSDQKYQRDLVFANERKADGFEDVIKEAEAMNAKGAGITGGDPLQVMGRTLEYIRKLKEHFGKQFHIHLYTSLNLVNKENLKNLYLAGLDEIRFHPDFDSKKYWGNISLAKKFSWDVGVEIPLIPNKEKEIKGLIDFIHDKVKFLNLNELEVADNKQSKLLKLGFKTKNDLSYAVAGSLELGLSLIEYIKKKNYPLNVHLCTAKLKDAVQLGNRIKREAKGVKQKFDLVDEEGMLIRGALYLEELKPGFDYRKRINELNETDNESKQDYLNKLTPLFERIKKKFKLDADEITLDLEKPRILLSKRLVKKKKNYFLSLGLIPAIVTEYPTADQLEVEVEFLD